MLKKEEKIHLVLVLIKLKEPRSPHIDKNLNLQDHQKVVLDVGPSKGPSPKRKPKVEED